jgi:hypothetical protein
MHRSLRSDVGTVLADLAGLSIDRLDIAVLTQSVLMAQTSRVDAFRAMRAAAIEA